jgi:metallophosphoesterase (TIGR00282 family)
MQILFVADVFGRPGRTALAEGIIRWRTARRPALTIVNGENAAGGFGITADITREMLDAGVDVVTSGNHIWDKREIYAVLEEEPRLLRPDNYPAGNPGSGVWTGEVDGVPVAVVNLEGRVFMRDLECPFRRIDALLAEGPVAEARVRIVDFHAEATSEKNAFGRHVDGRVTAVIGTHTHVPSADARVLPGGTAYVTDAGMTGPHEGVIGVDAKAAIARFLLQTPTRFEVARGDVRFQGILVTADPATGKATGIERIDEPRRHA